MVLGYLDLYFCRMGLKITGSPCNVGLSNLVSQKASRSQSNTIVLCHHRRYYATANSRRPCDIFRLCIGLGMAMKSKVTTTVLNFWKVAWISNTFWYCALFRRNQFCPDQNCFERGVQIFSRQKRLIYEWRLAWKGRMSLQVIPLWKSERFPSLDNHCVRFDMNIKCTTN